MAWMYILKCVDGSFYIGSTIKLESRIFQLQQGRGAIYTSRRLPVELVYCEEYQNVAEAFAREKQIQNWSHAKREALVQGSFQKLSELSKKKFNNNHPGVCKP
jgi:putative endonuclease